MVWFVQLGIVGRVWVNLDGLKLNGTHQLLVCVDGVDMLGGSVHAVKENGEASVVASKEIGCAVNLGKTRYMVMSGDQTAAARSDSMETDSSSVWIRKTNWMSLFVLFISLLLVAQHVSGNHVPIIRS
jgi:hypothetical protein